jgi:hypothetical protein
MTSSCSRCRLPSFAVSARAAWFQFACFEQLRLFGETSFQLPCAAGKILVLNALLQQLLKLKNFVRSSITC